MKQEMSDVYFWAEYTRSVADAVPLDTTSEWYLDKIKYPGDPWSRLEGDAFEGELASIDDGSDTGFGWIITLWNLRAGATTRIEAKINHLYPGSPAHRAGAQRGDFITRVDGNSLTNANVAALFNTRTPITIELRKKNNTTTTLQLTPATYDIQPIAKDTVITSNGKAIGYIFYTAFVYKNERSLQDLTAAFTRFKQANVQELILDLRYNGGGYLTAAAHLASLLAPAENSARQDVLIYKIWNEKYQEQYANTPSRTIERLHNTIPATARLELPRLWVLTSGNTASASEIVISGLAPYMQVHTIGDTTSGKNAGGSVFAYPDDKTRGVYLITMQYTNSAGQSVAGGIPRSISYNAQTYYNDTTALGNPRETFIAIALQNINAPAGRSPATTIQAPADPVPAYPARPRLILPQ
jgi:C-terminal processing protease CtpA/Prc